MGGDPEANFIHYAIQKLHWTPQDIYGWLDTDQSVKAFYFASVELKIKNDKTEADKIKRRKR